MTSGIPGAKLRKSYFIFFELSPFQILTLKICNCDISKSIIAKSFKLGQLIEDDEWNTWCKFKKKLFYFSMPPTLKKWGAYCFWLVRLFVCPYKPMGTPVAIKFGQLDTQVVIFEYK